MKRKFNYTGNVNCNMIKPMERKFFKYLIKQINYDEVEILFDKMAYKAHITYSMEFYIEEFCNKYNCTKKLLNYYIRKWERVFMTHDINNTDCYYFIIPMADNKFKQTYPADRYKIPDRVMRKLYQKSISLKTAKDSLNLVIGEI